MPSERESVLLDGDALGALAFEWCGDRFNHSWSFPNSPVRLQSVESDCDAAWPESPPLQQIHSQSFGDGREVIFGVGMAGRGHWSASFTLVPDLRYWVVELACKLTQEPERLVSSYRIQSESGTQVGQPDGPLVLDSDNGIVVEPVTPGELAWEAPDIVRFLPSGPQVQSQTIQWAFRIRVSPET